MKKIDDKVISFYTLKRIYPDDIALMKQYYLWQISEDRKDMFSFMPVANHIIEYSEEGFNDFKEQFKEIVKSTLYYLLEQKDSRQLLGWIAVNDYNPRNQNLEIGYYFPKHNRSKGYGTILMSLFLKEVFADDFFWKINKISAETASLNTSSVRLLEKFCFQLDGKIREHYWIGQEKYDQLIFTLLRKDYCTDSYASD